MKYALKLLLLLCLSTAIFSGCKKDSNDFEGMRVTIDGQLWTATSASGTSSNGTLSVAGTELTTLKSLSIIVPSTITAGTYNIDPTADIICTFSIGLSTLLIPDSGKLVISKHDTGAKQIKGTFEFSALDIGTNKTSTFTGGEFNVKYQ